MTSKIPGFEYDIFISYRQKDNKYDGWVTEFVENLKNELDATFKEEVTIYFDINPHDGLLETHDVDASLKKKLKCLVFIPVISQTYCDTSSFAWQHEFIAFINSASKDQFGLKVTLPNGNVASRILPVQIHDLEPADKGLLERELGGVLRSVDFIYREEGINRPLKPTDEDKTATTKTKYRNQVNKTANAIKEIISGLKSELEDRSAGQIESGAEGSGKPRFRAITRKNRWVSVGLTLLLLVTVGLTLYSILTRDPYRKLKDSEGKLSVSIMPFWNETDDTLLNWLEDGIRESISEVLKTSDEIIVRDKSTKVRLKVSGLTNYSSITPSLASKISVDVGATVYLTGKIIKSGDSILLNAKLIDSKANEDLKVFRHTTIYSESAVFNESELLGKEIKNFLVLKILREKLPIYIQSHDVLTKSCEALKYYLKGQQYFFTFKSDEAEFWYKEALKADSTFYNPMMMIAYIYYNRGLGGAATAKKAFYDEGKKWCKKVYDHIDEIPSTATKLWVKAAYADFFETLYEYNKYMYMLKDLDDKDPEITYNLGASYWFSHEYDKAIAELKRSLDIYKQWGVKPQWVNDYTVLCEVYLKTDSLDKIPELLKCMERDFPKDPDASLIRSIMYLKLGDTAKANDEMERNIAINKAYNPGRVYTQASLSAFKASNFARAEIYDKAEEFYRIALSLEPDKSGRMYSLSSLLINSDRDINEGLEIIDKALEISPNNYAYLDCKGWGLYKKGKYKEALVVLQKADSLKPIYNYTMALHLAEVKKAVAGMKN